MVGSLVKVKQGWLRGTAVETILGTPYIFFKGVPYAEPPVGSLRFSDPQPLQPWTGIRNAYTEGSKCAQFNMYSNSFVGDDDCLHLNIATKSLAGSRPVMFWIHGGGFTSGDGGADMGGPDYLMESNIVYVGINYRLGVLGFLDLEHEVAPGNMGLKDQVAALKWVKENISQFGGDPNNVTIFGQSAGSASVHYLLLSPLAKGLFHKAILQSGLVTESWSNIKEPVKIARRYVAALGKDITDPIEMVEYLRTIPAIELIKTGTDHTNFAEAFKPGILFGPTVDVKSAEPFISKPMEELVGQGFDVPVIIGYNNDESALMLMGTSDETFTQLNENFERTLPKEFTKAPATVPDIVREIRKFYFGDNPTAEELSENFARYHRDLFFVIGAHKTVEIQLAKKSPTYFYRFSYKSPTSTIEPSFNAKANGATHGEELQYLFYQSLVREHIVLVPGSIEDVLRQRFVRMWTDFARTGNPTPVIDDLITEKWKPITETTKNYLEINADLSMGVNPDGDSWKMWKRMAAIVDEG